MKKQHWVKKFIAAFCVSFLLLTTIDCIVPGEESKIYDSIIRLHILASSNGEADQKVKLLVRDAVIDECGDLFCAETDTEQAKITLAEKSEKMVKTAQRVLRENGFDYSARAEIGVERYPTCEYDGISFPAGEYSSLKIILGEGEGKNWWCVLFPPLCLNASQAKKSLASVGINSATGRVYTEKRYLLRFKFLELFG